MIVIPTKDFDKSVRKISDKIARKRLDLLIEKLEKAQSMSEISDVKALAKYPFFTEYERAIIV